MKQTVFFVCFINRLAAERKYTVGALILILTVDLFIEQGVQPSARREFLCGPRYHRQSFDRSAARGMITSIITALLISEGNASCFRFLWITYLDTCLSKSYWFAPRYCSRPTESAESRMRLWTVESLHPFYKSFRKGTMDRIRRSAQLVVGNIICTYCCRAAHWASQLRANSLQVTTPHK